MRCLHLRLQMILDAGWNISHWGWLQDGREGRCASPLHPSTTPPAPHLRHTCATLVPYLCNTLLVLYFYCRRKRRQVGQGPDGLLSAGQLNAAISAVDTRLFSYNDRLYTQSTYTQVIETQLQPVGVATCER